MLPKTKSTYLEKENDSPKDSLSPDSLSHADGMSEKPFSKGGGAFESESVDALSEDESGKSPSGCSVGHTAFESPSRGYSDNHFRKSPEADAETHSFDEPTLNTFDNNDDTDSVWGFNHSDTKDLDHEKHGEKYLFGSSDFGDSPRRTESPQADSMFPKKSLFNFEDSVPSTPLSRAGNSPPRYSVGSADPFFDNVSRFDSFSMHDHASSPRRETLSKFDSMNSTRGFDHNQGTLTRFDSINSTRGFDHSQQFSSFDDADPFGSSGPVKVSSESQTPRKGSDKWSSF